MITPLGSSATMRALGPKTALTALCHGSEVRRVN
jgi:hypothetical protein